VHSPTAWLVIPALAHKPLHFQWLQFAEHFREMENGACLPLIPAITATDEETDLGCGGQTQ